MTTINQARFKIDGTPSEDPTTGDPGYVATFAQTLDCTLEISPSSALSVTYSIFDPTDESSPLASYGAPSLTWVGSGLSSETLASPNGTAQIIMPGAGVASFLIRCTAVMPEGAHTYERLVAINATTVPAVRKTVPAEVGEFYARGWSDEQNKMVDALLGAVAPVGIDSFGSAGTYQATWVVDAGGAMVNVAAGTGWLRTTASVTGTLVAATWLASAGIAIPADSTRYIGVEYNGGAPQVVSRVANSFSGLNDFILATVYNEAGTLHILEHEQSSQDAIQSCYSRFFNNFPLSRGERAGGLIVGDTGVRNLTMSAGLLFDGFSRFTISAIDTSAASTFDYYYRDGGVGWTKVAAQTQYSSSHYDDGTGVLHALTAAHYGITWWYLESDGHVVGVYGQADYASLADAEDSTPPASLPGRITAHGILLGRTIVLRGAAAATEVESIFSVEFGMTAVSDHNSLGGLQGGGAGEYYHLTAAQTTDLTDGGVCTSHVHTLDQSYDSTGAGLGRSITADSGAVDISVPIAVDGTALALHQLNVAATVDVCTIENLGASGASIGLTGTRRWIESDSGDVTFGLVSNDVNTYTLHLSSVNTNVAGVAKIGICADDDVDITSDTGCVTIHGYDTGTVGIEIEAVAGGGSVDIGAVNLPNQLNLGTGGIRTVVLGSVTGAAITTLRSGTGAFTVTAGGTFDVNVTGAVTIDAAGASGITIGGDANTGAIGIGTGAAARAITLGNVTATTGVTVNTGTAGFTVNTTGAGTVDINGTAAVSIESTGGSIEVGAGANAYAVNLGTGGAARVVTVGSTNTTSSLALQSGTGLISFTDGYKAGGGYAGAFYLALNAAEYTAYEANFGEVSLLNAINQCATSAVTLDEAYNASGGASLVTVDAGDVTWAQTGAYSFVVDLTATTGASTDGFLIENGTDYFRTRYAGVGDINIDAEVKGFNLDATGTISFNAININSTSDVSGMGTLGCGAITSTGTLDLGANSITMTGSIATTGARVTKGWFTDIECTNAITGSITGNAATVTVADTASATCWLGLYEAASGSLAGKTDTALTYNATTGALAATSVAATAALTGASSTLTTAGVAKSVTDVLTINNSAHAGDMDGTGSAILWNLTEDTGATLVDAGRIAVIAEQDLTSTASTQDTAMVFSTSLDGTLAEKARITSAGRLGLMKIDPLVTFDIYGTGAMPPNTGTTPTGHMGFTSSGGVSTFFGGNPNSPYAGWVQVQNRAALGSVYPYWINPNGGDVGIGCVTKGANLGLGMSVFGTSAAGVLGLASGTAPTTSPADAVQMWSADLDGGAGAASLYLRTENHRLAFGTSIGGVRHETADTAGVNQTFRAGGATVGATNKNGGNLLLYPGVSTGSGTSYALLGGYPGIAAATTDNTVVDTLRATAAGVYIGPTTGDPTAYLHLKAGTATAGQAPLKFTDGVLLATAEEGAEELDVGTRWMTPISTQREAVVGVGAAQYEAFHKTHSE